MENERFLDKKRIVRIVHKEFFSREYKIFSDFLYNIAKDNENIVFHKAISYIQTALFGKGGKKLKEEKNIPLNEKNLTRYMNGLELKMYTEAFKKINHYFLTSLYSWYPLRLYPEEKEKQIIAANKFYDKIWDIVRDIPNSYNVTLDKSGEPIDGFVKTFNRNLKLGEYKNILISAELLQDKGIFNPYSNEWRDRYEAFRMKFIQIVENLRALEIKDELISNWFNIYDTYFYDTQYLQHNKISTIKYVLGLTDEVYFTPEDLKWQEIKLQNFDKCIKLIKEEKRSELFFFGIIELAKESRENFQGKNTRRLPEFSNLFLISCLDKIAAKTAEKESFPTTQFLTQGLINIDDSIDSLVNATKKRIELPKKYYQPTLWGEGYINEPRPRKTGVSIRTSRSKKQEQNLGFNQ